MLELYRQMFVRSGAALEGAAAERLTAVKSRLAVLGTAFGQNLLAEERGWSMALVGGRSGCAAGLRAGRGKGGGRRARRRARWSR